MALTDSRDARCYGFEWPGDRGRRIPTVQVTRTSMIDRGKRGVWKALTIHSDYGELTVYVSPTGRFRVFGQTNQSPSEEWVSAVVRSRRGQSGSHPSH